MKRISIAAAMLFASLAQAQVSVEDPWVRATVPQQKTTGAFMRITSAKEARVVEAKSPAAGVVELHEMQIEKDIMKMRRVGAINLPAGKEVELQPGAHHIMLMDLKGQLKEGDQVSLTLTIEAKDGKRESLELTAPVRPLNHSGPHKAGEHKP